LIKWNIRFLKEKIRSLCHSLPFEQVPGIMVVRMVLHIEVEGNPGNCCNLQLKLPVTKVTASYTI
jgi:hypothetical protein